MATKEKATQRIVLIDIPDDIYDQVSQAIEKLHRIGIIRSYSISRKVDWTKRGNPK